MGWYWLTDMLLLRSFAIGLTVIGCYAIALVVGKWLLWAYCCLM